MKKLTAILTISLLLSSLKALAISAIETNGHIVVNHPRQSHTLKIPDEMKHSASYKVIIYPRVNARTGSNDDDLFRPGETLEVMLTKANVAYQEKDFEKSLKIIMKAHEHYPDNIKVNNMIGSLFYKLKDNEMAYKFWSRSLALDENQPKVKKYLEKIPKPDKPNTQP